MTQQIHSIRYPFSIDKGFGVLAEESDYGLHVEQMIKQVLFTNPGERINRPDFGCGISRMVFAPNSYEGDYQPGTRQVARHPDRCNRCGCQCHQRNPPDKNRLSFTSPTGTKVSKS
jgi:hypothetical protein